MILQAFTEMQSNDYMVNNTLIEELRKCSKSILLMKSDYDEILNNLNRNTQQISSLCGSNAIQKTLHNAYNLINENMNNSNNQIKNGILSIYKKNEKTLQILEEIYENSKKNENLFNQNKKIIEQNEIILSHMSDLKKEIEIMKSQNNNNNEKNEKIQKDIENLFILCKSLIGTNN
jgi:vacuolar-type H+-ATPase catalytic subunit A/Vma1